MQDFLLWATPILITLLGYFAHDSFQGLKSSITKLEDRIDKMDSKSSDVSFLVKIMSNEMKTVFRSTEISISSIKNIETIVDKALENQKRVEMLETEMSNLKVDHGKVIMIIKKLIEKK